MPLTFVKGGGVLYRCGMDYKIDAKNKPLGRVASEIAVILQGKKSAKYEPNKVGGDRVLIENVQKIAVTGRKYREKVYHRHTGYVGHLKTKTFEQEFTGSPERVLRDTVRRMLPKNFLKERRLKNLIFLNGEK